MFSDFSVQQGVQRKKYTIFLLYAVALKEVSDYFFFKYYCVKF